MKKTKRTIKGLLALAALVVSASISAMAQDYNGNLISKNKVIFNSKSSNSYIQSLTSHTINFDGLMDQTFGNLGSAFISPRINGSADSNDQCNAIAIQPDGKIVMGGTSSNNTLEQSFFAAARYLPSGQLDTSFGTNGVMSIIPTIYERSSGVYVAGDSDACNSIAIQPDGCIVMGGQTSDANGDATYFAAARLLPSGQLDTTFGDGGTMYVPTIGVSGGYDVCHSLALQPDGKIVMGGESTGLIGNVAANRFSAVRLLPDGQVDTSFGDNGATIVAVIPAANTVCNSIALQPDGSIVMGRYIINTVDSVAARRFAAAQLLSNGLVDTSFGDNGFKYIDTIMPVGNSYDDECSSIALQPDGKIVMGGYTRFVYFAAARLLSNGQLDTSFGINGSLYLPVLTAHGSFERCNAIALQLDGKIVMGGFTDGSTNRRNRYRNGVSHKRFVAARLLINGQLDTSFGVKGSMCLDAINTGDTESCNAIALQSDGKIVMGGYTTDFSHKEGNYHFAVARLINPMSLQTYQASYEGVGAGLYV